MKVAGSSILELLALVSGKLHLPRERCPLITKTTRIFFIYIPFSSTRLRAAPYVDPFSVNSSPRYYTPTWMQIDILLAKMANNAPWVSPSQNAECSVINNAGVIYEDRGDNRTAESGGHFRRRRAV